MIHQPRWLPVLLAILLAGAAQAQPLPPQPPAPAKYKVALRYQIQAPRDPHVIAFDAMIKHMTALGFEFDPPRDKVPDTDREDRSKNYLKGTIDAKKALLLLEPTVVQSLLLVPDGFDLPADGDAPVTVRLELGGNLTPERQRELSNQTRVLLRELGFVEPVGYDHRGYTKRPQTRIVGTIARGKLDLLLRDLRNHPSGWFGPILRREEMPVPLRDINPVRVIEVLADTEAVKQIPDAPPRGSEDYEKISADLWALVKNKDVGPGRVRIQIGFIGRINPDDTDWKTMLEEMVPDFFIEGQLGQFVTGIIRLDQVKRLAMSPVVSIIRLPRTPAVNVDPAVKIKGDNAKALEQTGLTELHERGYRGQGVRIGIIDSDFRGWEALVKKKLLPARTRLVDLTTTLDPELYPKRYAGDPEVPGHGTLCAQAAALAAPDAEIVLIRIETIDPHDLQDILRYVQGGRFSALVEKRDGELVARGGAIRARRTELLKERKPILEDFTDETDQAAYLDFLGPFYAWLYSDREWHRLRMEYHEAREAEFTQLSARFNAHIKAIRTLDGIPILVNALSWQNGYPLGAGSPLSRLLDNPKGPLWFQSVGNTRGQNWIGRFRQTPGDPAMKFADDAVPLPKGSWSNEINFLRWQPYAKAEPETDIPAKTRLRLTLQWREPHDPDYYMQEGEDLYRLPLASMRLQLIRQRDPEAKVLPGDSFELVGRTLGGAERIEHLPGGSVYEQVLETTLAKGGRYAVRVEKQVNSQWVFVPHPQRKTPMFQLLDGLVPTGIRPLGVPTLPALEKNWDFRPRLFVEVIDDENRLRGRAVFADFTTINGSIGSPADARNVISVGAASLKNTPQPYSAYGAPAGAELATRPWLYAYDELDLAGGGAFGASIANAFAAGTTAAMLGGNLTRDQLVQMLRDQEGKVLRVPIRKK
jgi:hypothetical protein